jgi:hypothetical protein
MDYRSDKMNKNLMPAKDGQLGPSFTTVDMLTMLITQLCKSIIPVKQPNLHISLKYNIVVPIVNSSKDVCLVKEVLDRIPATEFDEGRN